jgi:hypothetical protein
MRVLQLAECTGLVAEHYFLQPLLAQGWIQVSKANSWEKATRVCAHSTRKKWEAAYISYLTVSTLICGSNPSTGWYVASDQLSGKVPWNGVITGEACFPCSWFLLVARCVASRWEPPPPPPVNPPDRRHATESQSSSCAFEQGS